MGYRHDRLNFGTVNNGIVLNGLGPAGADFSIADAARPVAQHADARLEPDRIQPRATAVCPGQVAPRCHRQPVLRAALATRHVVHRRIVIGYALGILGYAAGLVLSTVTDLPSGPAIVWSMTALALVFALASGSRAAAR